MTITIEDIKNSEVFHLAFIELEREGISNERGWESELFIRARRIASSLAKRRLWKGVQIGNSPYNRGV